MRLVEFEVSTVNTEKLAALSQFLLSRTDDTNAKKTMPVSSFIDLANNMGVSLTDDQLRNLIQQPPLSEIIANIEGDSDTGTITFKGADEVAPNMSVDQARDTVNTMAKRAASKPGL
jgi:hypothetical protein